MLAAHVEQEVHGQAPAETQDAEVVLPRRQLELLGLCELGDPPISALALGRGAAA
jgi:hypothetical protein